MNTPITDAVNMDRYVDHYEGYCAMLNNARRLELDRATFRQALIDIYLSPASDSRGLANAALQAASKFEGEEHTP